MTYQGIPKISLVAHYDDLCRYTKILTSGPEEEFRICVENQLNSMHKWKETESDGKKLNDQISNLFSEKKCLETQIKHLQNLCEAEIMRRRKVESECNDMWRQISLIKEILLTDGVMDNQTKEKLGFLSSTSRPNFNSPPCLETTEEPTESVLSLLNMARIESTRHSSGRCDRQFREKWSSSESKRSPEKMKADSSDKCESKVTENVNPYYKAFQGCSNSEPTSSSREIPAISQHGRKSDSDQFKYNTSDFNTWSLSGGTPVSHYKTVGKLSQTHSFIQKTVIRTEKCYPCGRIVKFCKQALKCNDCRVICHPECRDQCSLPCIPTVNTPTKGVTGAIADYTSSASPMIPSLIVHCINEIESRGLRENSLYHISGSEREVKDLKEKFLRGRTIPCLNQIDVHTICGTVKEFLHSLKEPLVTHAAWQTFIDTANLTDISLSLNALFETVMNLPQPNRDTLSFLILHLQRVAESPECKIPIENLARDFGQIIVGYSVPDLADGNMLKETEHHQCKVMQLLLSIPSDSWQYLLNTETDVFLVVQ